MPRKAVPEPWRSFLRDLEKLLDSRVSLVCVGGFAVAMAYGLQRPTSDIDVFEVRPVDALHTLLREGGAAGPLHKRYGVHLQIARVMRVPDGYETRLIEIFPGRFRKLRLRVLDPYDLALSKLERNSDQDIEDVKHLARTVPLDLATLRERYSQEMRPLLGRPDREDLTLQLWMDAIQEERRSPA